MSANYPSVALSAIRDMPFPSPDELEARSAEVYRRLSQRRTIRDYSDRPVPRDVIANCLLAAGTAPSGANLQPWHFAAISNPEIKRRIREAAEIEERAFYQGRAPESWLRALAPLGTDAEKPFLETAPWLIAIFARNYGIAPDGSKEKHYYVPESVGIASGLLITALHETGLVTLTHTPSPMGFLGEILERPENERAYLLLVVGYPREDARVPDIGRQPIEGISSFFE